MDEATTGTSAPRRSRFLSSLRERGVLRVAASYAVIAWLALQIASVVFDPLGVPKWVLTALIIAAAVGFPVAIALAWFLEVGEHGVELDTAAEGVPRPSARGLRHYADAIVIGALLVAVVVLAVRQSDLGKPKPPENPAIAVLPFENLSGDPAQEYFSDGLAEEMLDRLGRVPGLRVIARASSFSFKGQEVDSKTIAARLGVTTLLEGSVRRDGKRLKLSARLIDGATGQQTWSGSFDREVTDVFDVQAELARAVVDAIIPAARGDVLKTDAPPTTDLNAYDLYLLARTQLALRLPESIRKSVELMEQAVRLDPKFARAHAQLAASLLFSRLLDDQAAPEQSAALLRDAEASIHRALALDPNLSEAHGTYANLLRDTSRPGAEEEYKRALELNPGNAASWHDYAVFLSNNAQRPEESIAATKRSLELDPRQPVTWANYLTYVAHQDRKQFETERARAIRAVGDMPGAVDRFPVRIWAEDRAGYHREFERLLPKYVRVPGVLDSLMLPGAVISGFPVEIMKVGITRQRNPIEGSAPHWAIRYRAWQPVDIDRAERALPEQARTPTGVNFRTIRMFLEADLAGHRGDWSQLDRIFDELLRQGGDEDRHVRSVMAFWLAVQGRYREAAQSLALAEPLDHEWVPPVLGGDTDWGLMETAKVRILRETGRKDDADRFAANLLARLRSDQRRSRGRCDYTSFPDSPMRLASLAANEGLKDEAVTALMLAMHCGDLPFSFWPPLPWFRSLEGYGPYDELVRERERRIAKARAELLRLEADAGSAALQPGEAAATPREPN
jgi:adenylate cyclase